MMSVQRPNLFFVSLKLAKGPKKESVGFCWILSRAVVVADCKQKAKYWDCYLESDAGFEIMSDWTLDYHERLAFPPTPNNSL